MRRFWIGLALTGLMVASAAAGAWAASGTRKTIEVEYRDIKIAVNGKAINVGDVEPFIYVEKGRTFVPARPLAEALGAKVGWNDQTSTVEVYTPTYLKVTAEGDLNVWSMPAQGFSIKAPKSFIRQDMGTSLLQLAMPDPATGTNSVVAVSFLDTAGETSTAKERLDSLVMILGQTFLPDAKVTETVQDGNKLTASGTSTLFGKVPATFAIRLVSTAAGDWLLLTMTPSGAAGQTGPVLKGIMDSFTLTP